MAPLVPAAVAVPTPAPTPRQIGFFENDASRQAKNLAILKPQLAKRNVNGPSTGLTYTTPTSPATALAQSTDPSAATSSTITSPNPTDTSTAYGLFGGGLPTNVLNYVAIFLVALVIFTLISARYIFLKRYGKVGFREYFVPVRGIHIKWLGIHIRGPTRVQPPVPAAIMGYMTTQERRRRRRRGRETTGADIREGGRRGGSRDADDGDSIVSADDLPKYEVDTSLPGYHESLTTTTTNDDQPRDRTSADSSESGPSTPSRRRQSSSEDPEAAMPDVQAYEAQTRGLSVPPPAHTADDGSVVRPTRPPLVSAASANPPPSYEMQEMRRRDRQDDDNSSEEQRHTS